LIYILSIFVLITAIYICSLVYIIIGFIRLRSSKNKEVLNNESYNISVIIPVRNEEENIRACLESLKNQNYKRSNFELIIINDHSTDDTVRIVNNFIKENDLNIHLFPLSDVSSKKEALKYGIEKSNYEIIATTDADCRLPINWLQHISKQFKGETKMLLGPVIFNQSNGFLSSFQTLDMLAIQGMEFGVANFRNPILNNAANLSYSKESYLNVDGFDGFDTPSGDDIFLLEKFKANNKKITGLLNRDFIVETESELSIKKFLNQRLRWTSKTKYYSDKMLIFFSSIVLIQNVLMGFIYLGISLVEKYAVILIILLFCKWLIDFILLLLVASFFKRKRALFYFIPVQIVYPIYIILIWIASMTLSFEWKGRKFNE